MSSCQDSFGIKIVTAALLIKISLNFIRHESLRGKETLKRLCFARFFYKFNFPALFSYLFQTEKNAGVKEKSCSRSDIFTL